MSVLTDVLIQARAGGTVDRIAGTLRVDPGLVEAALDHWARLGVVTRADDLLGCGTCGTDAAPPPTSACAGCPLVPLRARR